MKLGARGEASRTTPIKGDVVRVRSKEEILATLDADGTLNSLPFMPEMLAYCGKSLPIAARADKTCDTVEWTGMRRMTNTVHLAGARCDGSAHGGCQAGCNLFWRQEWLEWPDSPGLPITPSPGPRPADASEDTLTAATNGEPDAGEVTYRCQATQLFKATDTFPRHHYAQYVNEVRNKNVSAGTMLWSLLILAFNNGQQLSTKVLPQRLRIRGGMKYPFVAGTGTGERTPTLGLQPGDLVEVKSKAEILATLGPDNRNRGMWFDAEMLPFVGRRARVQRHVDRILDEKTGKMIKLRDCVVLADMACMGLYRGTCTRAITPYWREAWLRRVEETDSTGDSGHGKVGAAKGV
jgi:hypothetical protein